MKILIILTTLLILSLNTLSAQDGFTTQDRKMLLENRKMLLENRKMLLDIKDEIVEVRIGQEKLETKVGEMDRRFGERFEQMDKRLEQMDKSIGYNYTTLWIIAGIFTAFTVMAITIALRDRKTSIEASVKKSMETREEEGTLAKVVDVFKQLAKDDKKVAQALKQFNL